MIIHFNYFYENHSPRIFHSNWYKIIKKEKEKKNHFHCAKFRRRTTQLCPTLNCPRQWFRVQHWDTRLMLILMYKIMQLQELFLYLTDLNLQKHNPPMFNQSLGKNGLIMIWVKSWMVGSQWGESKKKL